jgi:hypothetical protein
MEPQGENPGLSDQDIKTIRKAYPIYNSHRIARCSNCGTYILIENKPAQQCKNCKAMF